MFVHKHYSGTKKCPNTITGERPTPPSIETFGDKYCQELKERTVVGVDPGKFNIVYMTDGEKKLRYTAYQRRTETMAKRNQRILLTEKKGMASLSARPNSQIATPKRWMLTLSKNMCAPRTA